jgi:hypothetical protein
MKMKTTTLIVIFFLMIGLPGLQAQQTILSAGNNAAGTGGSASYSVGQPAFNTFMNGSATISEGVQQPYEILFMEGVDPDKGIILECLVYPNPAISYVRLKTETREISDLSYQLYNMNGLLLLTKRIESDETCIPLEDLAPDTYLLTVSGKGKAVKTYKIIKK